MMEAVLSNADHPEYGVATIPLPIPRNQYDHCVALLEALEIGDASEADCRVDSLDSAWPVLNRLVSTKVNLDELDYLAKRLDSFSLTSMFADNFNFRHKQIKRMRLLFYVPIQASEELIIRATVNFPQFN